MPKAPFDWLKLFTFTKMPSVHNTAKIPTYINRDLGLSFGPLFYPTLKKEEGGGEN